MQTDKFFLRYHSISHQSFELKPSLLNLIVSQSHNQQIKQIPQYLNSLLRHFPMKEDNLSIQQITEPKLNILIEQVIVAGLNKHCKCRSDDQQLIWITRLEILSHGQFQADQLYNHHQNKLIKYRSIGNGLYLKLWFCEKNKKPIIKIKSSRIQSNNEAIPLEYPFRGLEEQYIFYMVNDKQNEKRIIEDIEMVEVSTENDLQMPEDNSYEIVRLPQAFQNQQNQQEDNSSNQQLVQKTRYLLVKTLDLEDQQHQFVQHFQPEVIFHHSMKKKTTQIQYKSFPHFCFPEGIVLHKNIEGYGYSIFNFILTQEDGTRIYVSCLKIKEELQEEILQTLPANCIDKYIHNHQKLFTQKAICLVSKYCVTQFFHSLLQQIFRKYQSRQNQFQRKLFSNHSRQDNIQFKEVINEFIREYELGFKEYQRSFDQIEFMKDDFRMEMNWNGNKIVFPTPSWSDHRSFSRQAVHCLFKMLSVDKIVTIVQSLLLQKSVVFVSESQVAVGYAIESLVSFLYPLRWQNVILPMLPSNMIELLQAPMPLIGSIPLSFATDEVIYKLKQESVVVFLDLNQIINVDENAQSFHVNHFKEALKKLRIYDIYSKRHVEDMLKFKDHFFLFKVHFQEERHFSTEHIKHIFFETILLLIQNYQYYCQTNDKSPVKLKTQAKQNGNSNQKKKTFHFKKDFMMEEFLKSHPKSNMKFMRKFAQSSHFVQFLYRSHQEKNIQKQIIDLALRRQKNNAATENIFNVRYSQKFNSTQVIGSLRKQTSLPSSAHNVTWSPPPKKSDLGTTMYSRNNEKSLKLEDIQIQREKSLSAQEKNQRQSAGKFICQAIARAMNRVSNTRRNLILWTQARVARLKKQFIQNKQKETKVQNEKAEVCLGKQQQMIQKSQGQEMKKQPERKMK